VGTGTWLHSFMRACTLWSLGQPRAEHPFGAGSAMHCMLRCWGDLGGQVEALVPGGGTFASRN
jgi:hypothetical protein